MILQAEESGEGVMWDLGVDLFHYLLCSICIAGAL